MEWFSSMDSLEKVLWIIALTSSLVFIVQTVMTFMGMDGDGDPSGCDVGVSEDMPLELFTFRNFVNFFLGFSWTAIALYGRTGLVVTVVSGVIAGVLLVAAVMYMFYLMSRMEQSGNIDLQKKRGGMSWHCLYRHPRGRTRQGADNHTGGGPRIRCRHGWRISRKRHASKGCGRCRRLVAQSRASVAICLKIKLSKYNGRYQFHTTHYRVRRCFVRHLRCDIVTIQTLSLRQDTRRVR